MSSIVLKLTQQDSALYNIRLLLSVLCVSGSFSAHHQELKNCTCSIGYLSNLFAVTGSLGESEWTFIPLIIRSSKTVHAASGTHQTCLLWPVAWVSQNELSFWLVWRVPDAACTVFELLMMSGKTARNTYSTDNNKRILYNAASCWLSLSYINDAQSHEH